MATYTIKNSQGTTVATITPNTTTGTTFPIELAGEGTSPYGQIIASTQYHLLENFSNTIAPSNAVTGMLWYDTSSALLNVYNGTSFQPLATATTSASVKYSMNAAATGINLATVSTTNIFTNPNAGNTFYPTALLLKVSGVPSTTDTAVFNLYTSSSEDILETSVISMTSSGQYALYNIQGTSQSVTGSNSVFLDVTKAVSSGTLTVDAQLFGYME